MRRFAGLSCAFVIVSVVVAFTAYSRETFGTPKSWSSGESQRLPAALKPPALEEVMAVGPLSQPTAASMRSGEENALADAFPSAANSAPAGDSEEVLVEEPGEETDNPLILAGAREPAAAGAGAGVAAGTWQELPQGTGEDKEIDSLYLVSGKNGPYRYGFVNITAGGVLLFLDANIDFWAKSILVEKDGELKVGSPTKPIGTANIANVVTFHLYGDQNDKNAVTCLSDKFDRCGVPDTQWVLKPSDKSSLPGKVTDYFYQYQKLPADDDLKDNNYFGRKVLAVSYGGSIRMFGKKGAAYPTFKPGQRPATISSWVRLDQSAGPGPMPLVLDRQVDWQVNDWIVVTTTDYLPGHSEQHQIKTIGFDGNRTVITTRKPLQYLHNGERYDLSAHKIPDRLNLSSRFDQGVETRAAVALLSRNIRIVSEGSAYNKGLPAPGDKTDDPSDLYFGGHTMARQGFKYFQMQGVELYQLGQGGRMAHSPINFHLARKAPPYTYVRDCSIWDSMTRWIEIRGTQNVDLSRNVGYLSIGHGYSLAEGTETHNTLQGNIGIYARPAVYTTDNPRKVPGVLAKSDYKQYVCFDNPDSISCMDKRLDAYLAYGGDYVHPSVFFVMNGYNTFRDNMAVGAGTCGACYWFAPAVISGLSRAQSWEGYAGIQTKNAGFAPLKSFKGNFCSTAQHSLMTIGTTGICRGVNTPDQVVAQKNLNKPEPYAFVPIPNKFNKNYDDPNEAKPGKGLYPFVESTAFLKPSICDEKNDTACKAATATKPCQKGQTENCAVTAIESYTSSFHWAQQNFSAIWLRTNWFLYTNSALTDVLNGGLTMVSGGSWDQVFNSYWGLTRKSVFVGHTQEGNPFAKDTGPVNSQSGLQCDRYDDENIPSAYCIVKNEGVNFPVDNFSVYQRLYNIYDGPVYQESNAYVNIQETVVDCGDGKCKDQSWQYAKAQGIPIAQEGDNKNKCIMPNAAIGWKQPNGFYYPPAFHSTNLYFDKVDLRHFVIVPLFKPGTNTVNANQVKAKYCTYDGNNPASLFSNLFTDVDRQTELNDDDGSLSGLNGSDPKQLDSTISVNTDSFFYAPVQVLECLSQKTCIQSPYDYMTAVVYPDCAASGGSGCSNLWGKTCTDRSCYGVPIYRQFRIPKEQRGDAQSIRMMGTETYQRSTLLANNGLYYIDTTRSAATQRGEGASSLNVFEKNKKYNFFLMYAKPTTNVVFQLYVGKGFTDDKVQMVRVGNKMEDGTVLTTPLTFTPQAWPSDWLKDYDEENGILWVLMNLGAYKDSFNKATEESCGPPSFCQWDAKNKACGCASSGKSPIDYQCVDSVCQWSTKASECPSGGCFGFQVTLPSTFTADDGFKTDDDGPDQLDHRPVTFRFPDDWNVNWERATQGIVGKGDCFYDDDHPPQNYNPYAN